MPSCAQSSAFDTDATKIDAPIRAMRRVLRRRLTAVADMGVAMDRASPISLWDASAQEPDYSGGDLPTAPVDLVIVGGGFTGLSTALHACEKGLSALVLEAEHIGYGGSGRNVGLVNAAAWLPPQEVRKTLGETYGPRFVDRFSKAPEYVFSLIERHQIRCEATRNGTIHAAHAPAGFRELQGRHDEWRRLGEPVDLLSRDDVAAMTGTTVFHGGLLDHRAGTINPMGYCRGLARAARGAGAEIATGVRATGLRREDGRWVVETDQGEVRGGSVVLGTNAYTDDLWPGLKDIFSTIHFFNIATEPLGDRAKAILPGRQGLWDTGQIMIGFRRDAFDRLLVGSMGRVIGTAEKGLTHRWATKTIARIFPELGPVRFEEAWHGQIAMTPDHLPRIIELAENLYTPIGYNGRGITTGTVFGQAMADLLTGAAKTDLPLPFSEPKAFAGGGIRRRAYDAAFTLNQIWKSL